MISLRKGKSIRANCDSQKDTEDNSNVMIDIDSMPAINICINNSVTDTANNVINFFLKNNMLYE